MTVMTQRTDRTAKLQLELTQAQAMQLHGVLTAALRAPGPQSRKLAAGSWRRYLDWRATRKWGLHWRDKAA